jgi:hypothetical protein
MYESFVPAGFQTGRLPMFMSSSSVTASTCSSRPPVVTVRIE